MCHRGSSVAHESGKVNHELDGLSSRCVEDVVDAHQRKPFRAVVRVIDLSKVRIGLIPMIDVLQLNAMHDLLRATPSSRYGFATSVASTRFAARVVVATRFGAPVERLSAANRASLHAAIADEEPRTMSNRRHDPALGPQVAPVLLRKRSHSEAVCAICVALITDCSVAHPIVEHVCRIPGTSVGVVP